MFEIEDMLSSHGLTRHNTKFFTAESIDKTQGVLEILTAERGQEISPRISIYNYAVNDLCAELCDTPEFGVYRGKYQNPILSRTVLQLCSSHGLNISFCRHQYVKLRDGEYEAVVADFRVCYGEIIKLFLEDFSNLDKIWKFCKNIVSSNPRFISPQLISIPIVLGLWSESREYIRMYINLSSEDVHADTIRRFADKALGKIGGAIH